MQRMVILIVLAALVALGGCAPRDPNLVVQSLSQFNRAAGDYTVHVNVYDLDADGQPRLVGASDPSLTGFVTRTLSSRGYVLRSGGPARYDLEVDLLCGNMRTANMSLISEALPVPASVVGPGYSGQIHYWLPSKGQGTSNREAQDRSDSMRMNREGRGVVQSNQNAHGGTPLGNVTPDFCQGRALVVLTPAATGAKREVFVGRAATDDCQAVPNCPVDVCRNALEQTLVDLLEHRF